MIFLPSLGVEGQERWQAVRSVWLVRSALNSDQVHTGEEGSNRVPALAHVLGASEDEASEGGVEGINAMVE